MAYGPSMSYNATASAAAVGTEDAPSPSPIERIRPFGHGGWAGIHGADGSPVASPPFVRSYSGAGPHRGAPAGWTAAAGASTSPEQLNVVPQPAVQFAGVALQVESTDRRRFSSGAGVSTQPTDDSSITPQHRGGGGDHRPYDTSTSLANPQHPELLHRSQMSIDTAGRDDTTTANDAGESVQQNPNELDPEHDVDPLDAEQMSAIAHASSATGSFELDDRIAWRATSSDITSSVGVLVTFADTAVEHEYHRFLASRGRAEIVLVFALVGLAVLIAALLTGFREPGVLGGWLTVAGLLLACAAAQLVFGVLWPCGSVDAEHRRTRRVNFITTFGWTVPGCLIRIIVGLLDRECPGWDPRFTTNDHACHRSFRSAHSFFILMTAAFVRNPRYAFVSMLIQTLGDIADPIANPDVTTDFAYRFTIQMITLVAYLVLNASRDRGDRAFFQDFIAINATRGEVAAQRKTLKGLVRAAVPARLLRRLTSLAPGRDGRVPLEALSDASTHAVVCVTSAVRFGEVATAQLLRETIQALHTLTSIFDTAVRGFGVDHATLYGDRYIVTAGLVAGSKAGVAHVLRFALWQVSTRFPHAIPLHSAVSGGRLAGGIAGTSSLRYVVQGPALDDALAVLESVPPGAVWVSGNAVATDPRGMAATPLTLHAVGGQQQLAPAPIEPSSSTALEHQPTLAGVDRPTSIQSLRPPRRLSLSNAAPGAAPQAPVPGLVKGSSVGGSSGIMPGNVSSIGLQSVSSAGPSGLGRIVAGASVRNSSFAGASWWDVRVASAGAASSHDVAINASEILGGSTKSRVEGGSVVSPTIPPHSRMQKNVATPTRPGLPRSPQLPPPVPIVTSRAAELLVSPSAPLDDEPPQLMGTATEFDPTAMTQPPSNTADDQSSNVNQTSMNRGSSFQSQQPPTAAKDSRRTTMAKSTPASDRGSLGGFIRQASEIKKKKKRRGRRSTRPLLPENAANGPDVDARYSSGGGPSSGEDDDGDEDEPKSAPESPRSSRASSTDVAPRRFSSMTQAAQGDADSLSYRARGRGGAGSPVARASSRPLNVTVAANGNSRSAAVAAAPPGSVVGHEDGAPCATYTVNPLSAHFRDFADNSVRSNGLSTSFGVEHPANAAQVLLAYGGDGTSATEASRKLSRVESDTRDTPIIATPRHDDAGGANDHRATDENPDQPSYPAATAGTTRLSPASLQSAPPGLALTSHISNLGSFEDPVHELTFQLMQAIRIVRLLPRLFGITALYMLALNVATAVERVFDDESRRSRRMLDIAAVTCLMAPVVGAAVIAVWSNFRIARLDQALAREDQLDDEREQELQQNRVGNHDWAGRSGSSNSHAGSSFGGTTSMGGGHHMDNGSTPINAAADVSRRDLKAARRAAERLRAGHTGDSTASQHHAAAAAAHRSLSPRARAGPARTNTVKRGDAVRTEHAAAVRVSDEAANRAGSDLDERRTVRNLQVATVLIMLTYAAGIFLAANTAMTNSPFFVAQVLVLIAANLFGTLPYWSNALLLFLFVVVPFAAAQLYQLNRATPAHVAVYLATLAVAIWAARQVSYSGRLRAVLRLQAEMNLMVIRSNTEVLRHVMRRVVPPHVTIEAVTLLRNEQEHRALDGWENASVATRLFSLLRRSPVKIGFEEFLPDFVLMEIRLRRAPVPEHRSSNVGLDDKSASSASAAALVRKWERIDRMVQQVGGTHLDLIECLGDAFIVGGPFEHTDRAERRAVEACVRLLLQLAASEIGADGFTAAGVIEEGFGAMIGECSLRYRVFGVAALHSNAIASAGEAFANIPSPGTRTTNTAKVAYLTRRFAQQAYPLVQALESGKRSARFSSTASGVARDLAPAVPAGPWSPGPVTTQRLPSSLLPPFGQPASTGAGSTRPTPITPSTTAEVLSPIAGEFDSPAAGGGDVSGLIAASRPPSSLHTGAAGDDVTPTVSVKRTDSAGPAERSTSSHALPSQSHSSRCPQTGGSRSQLLVADGSSATMHRSASDFATALPDAGVGWFGMKRGAATSGPRQAYQTLPPLVIERPRQRWRLRTAGVMTVYPLILIGRAETFAPTTTAAADAAGAGRTSAVQFVDARIPRQL